MSDYALIVEADAAASRLCRQALEESGFNVRSAESGVAGMVAVREHRPNLVLVAPQLHDVSGEEFVDWLRAVPDVGAMRVVKLADLRKPLSLPALKRALTPSPR